MMTKLRIFTCILLLTFVMLPSCSSSLKNPTDTSSMQDLSVSNNPYISPDDIENAEIVEETEYYKIISSDFIYYYYIFDKNHDIVKFDGFLNKEPYLSIVNAHLVKVTLQAGTGLGTQWGYYYDINADVFSRVFQSIYDQQKGKVAYGDIKKVIVRDIFDKTKYYQEISSFREPLAEVAEPIKNVEFINNGESVKISYLTGDNYRETTEIFNLT